MGLRATAVAVATDAIPKGDAVEMDGTVIDALPNSRFTVRLANGLKLLASTAGRLRHLRIRILLGDRVQVADEPIRSDARSG